MVCEAGPPRQAVPPFACANALGGLARIFLRKSGSAQKGNAEALGQLLGIETVVDSAEFQMPLVVVLAPGFQ